MAIIVECSTYIMVVTRHKCGKIVRCLIFCTSTINFNFTDNCSCFFLFYKLQLYLYDTELTEEFNRVISRR